MNLDHGEMTMGEAVEEVADEKMRVVLSVLRGEQSATDAARRVGVSEPKVHNWKRLFLDSGREGLAAQGRPVTAAVRPSWRPRTRSSRRRWVRHTCSCGCG